MVWNANPKIMKRVTKTVRFRLELDFYQDHEGDFSWEGPRYAIDLALTAPIDFDEDMALAMVRDATGGGSYQQWSSQRVRERPAEAPAPDEANQAPA